MKKIVIGIVLALFVFAGSAFAGQDTGGDKRKHKGKHNYHRKHRRHGRYRGTRNPKT
jgi:hypothetical protein